MKTAATNSWLFVALLSATGLWTSVAVAADEIERAQDAVKKAEEVIIKLQGSQHLQPPQKSGFFGSSAGGGKPTIFTGASAGARASSAIRKAAEEVRDAKGDEA